MRIPSPARRWLAAGAAFVTLLLGVAGPALARSATIPKALITAAVDAAGTMKMREDRTYDFKGVYHHGHQEIELPARSAVSEITLADERGPYRHASDQAPGLYQFGPLPGAPNMVQVNWNFTAVDMEKTFTLSYQLTNVFRLHQDTAELDWNFIGSGWRLDHDSVQINLTLPASPVKVWLEHGTGTVSVRGREVLVTAEHVRAGHLLTVRVLLPDGAVTQTGTKDDLTLAYLLTQAKQPPPHWPGLLLLVLGLVLSVYFFMRHVIPLKPARNYLPGPQPPGELLPTQAAAWHGSALRSALRAGVLDLVRRGVLHVSPLRDEAGVTRDWLVRRSKSDAPGDDALLNACFGDDCFEVTLSQWQGTVRTDRQIYAAVSTWYSWRRKTLPAEWFAPHQWWIYVVAVACGLAALMDPYIELWLWLVAAALVLLGALQHKLTQAGVDAAADWRSYRGWLEQNLPAPGLFPDDLSEPLIYAVALGLDVMSPGILDIEAGWGWYGGFYDTWDAMYVDSSWVVYGGGDGGDSGGGGGGDGGGGGGVD